MPGRRSSGSRRMCAPVKRTSCNFSAIYLGLQRCFSAEELWTSIYLIYAFVGCWIARSRRRHTSLLFLFLLSFLFRPSSPPLPSFCAPSASASSYSQRVPRHCLVTRRPVGTCGSAAFCTLGPFHSLYSVRCASVITLRSFGWPRLSLFDPLRCIYMFIVWVFDACKAGFFASVRAVWQCINSSTFLDTG